MENNTRAFLIAALVILLIISIAGIHNLNQKANQEYQENLITVKEMVNKQITESTPYEQKIKAIKTSCEFIFRNYANYKCNPDMLKYYNLT